MESLLEYFENGFVFTNEIALSAFVMYCLVLVEKYLSFIIAKNRIHIPLDLNSHDAAVELTADIFKKENNRLVKFANYFEKLNPRPENIEQAVEALKSFLFAIAKKRMLNLYRISDPDTYRIMRNLHDEIINLYLKTSYFNGEKYIYRKKIIFNESLVWQSEELVVYISRNIFSIKKLTYKGFIIKVLDLIESQNDFMKAVSFNNLVLLYKIFCVNSFFYHKNPEEIENTAHYNLLFDSVKLNFKKKLELYFHKKNICKSVKDKLNAIVDDFMQNLLKDGIRKTPSELTKKYFPIKDYKKYYHKVEYVLQMLISELMRQISEAKK